MSSQAFKKKYVKTAIKKVIRSEIKSSLRLTIVSFTIISVVSWIAKHGDKFPISMMFHVLWISCAIGFGLGVLRATVLVMYTINSASDVAEDYERKRKHEKGIGTEDHS